MATIAPQMTTPQTIMAIAPKSNIEALSATLDVANRVMIASLVAAALAAVVVAISTFLVIRWQGQLDKLKEAAFEKYKIESAEKVAAAQAEAANAGKTAAQANKETALARLEQERLKKEAAWRSVSAEQAEALKKALDGKHLKVALFFSAGDPEGAEFARSLAYGLHAAGVEIKGYGPILHLGEQPSAGLTVTGPDRKDVDDLTNALRASTTGPVLPEFIELGKDQPYVQMDLRVGPRPPPQFDQKGP